MIYFTYIKVKKFLLNMK
ncbi:hypothetical protein RUM_09330 [Ruminococcus champanellensis 18P13 = JCM 17042]|uniref:Uncharacterized protein n=1 Tax=Ruminococcus champanellensis (strain DSM 18848 / JCM 17042 / KCTC 15320 / 18P13) TaxID=213810 RepID=D4LBV9_RUMC1|nr:hypothetical protein RUM_09330 [Ruminococcus champanellensis 18P13 = JCM 17042]